MSEFQINKQDLAHSRLINSRETDQSPQIIEGEIALKVDTFSFTSNNITYAVLGDQLRYWNFFPAHNSTPNIDDASGWGVIPVWGFATVVESTVAEVPVGERLFGYFPPALYVTMVPINVSAGAFFDGSPHRVELPQGYNIYRRVAAEPNYDKSMDRERMLLYPLYVTSFCLQNMLEQNNWFEAKQVVIISASSKTSIGLAYALDEDENSPPVIGITSERNTKFVNTLGLHQQVLSYDELDDINSSIPTVIIDMANNNEVLGKLHTHLGDNMLFCSNVGLTHWDENKANSGIITERSEMFFAPGHIQTMIKEWGYPAFEQKSAAFIHRNALKSREWLTLRAVDSLAGLAELYPQVCQGLIPANEGLIIEL